MPTKKKKTKAEKELIKIQDALYRLRFAAHRCWYKFGHDEDEVPSDYKEWTELKTAIDQADHHIKGMEQ